MVAKKYEPLVLEIVDRYDVMTVRQLWYQLVNAGIENNRTRYKAFDRALTRMREAGLVPWSKFVDDTRQAYDLRGYTMGPGEWVEASLEAIAPEGYRLDPWAEQDTYAELWIEKTALMRIVAPIAQEFGVVLYPVRGYSSGTMLHEDAVPRLVDRLREGRQVRILYAGDCDPHGIQMDRGYGGKPGDIPQRLAKYGAEGIGIDRIALTPEQVKSYALPENVIDYKANDYVREKFIREYGAAITELDALSPTQLQDIVRHEIESLCDMSELARVRSVEEQNRGEVKRLLAALEAALDQP